MKKRIISLLFVLLISISFLSFNTGAYEVYNYHGVYDVSFDSRGDFENFVNSWKTASDGTHSYSYMLLGDDAVITNYNDRYDPVVYYDSEGNAVEKYETLYIPSTLDGHKVVGVFFGRYHIYEEGHMEYHIGPFGFNQCEYIEKVVIPDTVTFINSYAFTDCFHLKSITIPDTVTTIGVAAFANTDLSSVTIPNSVTGISNSTFLGCTSLNSITIPNSVTIIDRSAFAGCTNLNSITIPNSVTSIGRGAFDKTAWYNNQPDGIIYIGNLAYEMKGECAANVNIKRGTRELNEYLFFGCKELESVMIPDTVISIGNYAFACCTNLNSITIPNSVTSIYSNTFYDCEGLESIIIPRSVEIIYGGAFDRCYKLKNVYYTGSESDWNKIYIFSPYGFLTSANIHYNYTGTAQKDDQTGVSLSGDLGDMILKVIALDVDMIVYPYIGKITAAYDISLMKDGEETQPGDKVTVKIPCDNKNSKVYRVEENESLTDMEAKYEEGNLVFETNHFSTYIVATATEIESAILGDLDGDGDAGVTDATFVQRYATGIAVPFTDEQMKNGDVDGDGTPGVVDATFIQRYATGIATPFKIGKQDA